MCGRPGTDVVRLKADPDMRRGLQARAPPGRAETTRDEMAAALAYPVLLAVADIAPVTTLKRGRKGWRGSEESERDICARVAWGEVVRKQLHGTPRDSTLRKALKVAAKEENLLRHDAVLPRSSRSTRRDSRRRE